jgi:hypothetical protein
MQEEQGCDAGALGVVMSGANEQSLRCDPSSV